MTFSNAKPAFRFSVNSQPSGTANDFAEYARKLESLGFSTLLVPDGPSVGHAVFPALTWAAAATTTLHVGTYVIANDLHHPFHIAHNAATLHDLSGGRFELGIGAGRPGADAEYHALGLTIDKPGRRIARLASSVEIISDLLHGRPVTWDDSDYVMRDALLPQRLLKQGAPPVLVAGMGPRLLTKAGALADIVAIGTTPMDDWNITAERFQHVHDGASTRTDKPVLNMNFSGAGTRLASWFDRMPADQRDNLLSTTAPALLWGSTEEMVDGIRQRYEQFGVTSFTVSENLVDTFAPVVSRLAP